MKLNLKHILIISVLAFNCLSQNNGQNNTIGINFKKPSIFVDEENEYYGEESKNEDEYKVEDPRSIVDRWRHLYEQGKNIPIRKNVEHINQTFETLKTFEENIKYLLSPQIEKREIQKAIEFLMKIDLGVTNECYSALIHLFKAINQQEIWALKCK